jgi:broad specificity phosphatase PhoE
MRRLFFLLLLLLALPLAAQSPTLIVVRHAEAATGEDPGLTEAGTARANALAKALKDAGITAIYATQYQRTKDTAKPLAEALKLPVIQYDARAALPEIREGTVLIVGHSNTVPAIVKAATGKETDPIAHTEHDRLYVVSAGKVIVARF